MKTLVIIDFDINNPKAKIKIRTYRICLSRETEKHIVFFSKSGNSLHKRKRTNINKVIHKGKNHYEFAYVENTADINVIKNNPIAEKAIHDMNNLAANELAAYYKNLNKIQKEIQRSYKKWH